MNDYNLRLMFWVTKEEAEAYEDVFTWPRRQEEYSIYENDDFFISVTIWH